MGRHFIASFAHEMLDDALGVNRQTLVGVDDDAEQAGVGLKTLDSEALEREREKMVTSCDNQLCMILSLKFFTRVIE